jgi:hypothetical protein
MALNKVMLIGNVGKATAQEVIYEQPKDDLPF